MDIKQWFESKGSFVAGVNLYRATDYNATKLRQLESCFQLNYVPSNMMDMLKMELRGKMKGSHAAQTITKAPTPRMVAKKEPPEVIDLRKQAIPIHKEFSKIHAEMSIVETDEERLERAIKIMKGFIPSLDAIYDRIRTWKETGELPSVAAPSVVRETVEKMKLYLSHRSRISRLKGYLKKGKLMLKEQQTYEKELLDKETTVLAIKKELDL